MDAGSSEFFVCLVWIPKDQNKQLKKKAFIYRPKMSISISLVEFILLIFNQNIFLFIDLVNLYGHMTLSSDKLKKYNNKKHNLKSH